MRRSSLRGWHLIMQVVLHPVRAITRISIAVQLYNRKPHQSSSRLALALPYKESPLKMLTILSSHRCKGQRQSQSGHLSSKSMIMSFSSKCRSSSSRLKMRNTTISSWTRSRILSTTTLSACSSSISSYEIKSRSWTRSLKRRSSARLVRLYQNRISSSNLMPIICCVSVRKRSPIVRNRSRQTRMWSTSWRQSWRWCSHGALLTPRAILSAGRLSTSYSWSCGLSSRNQSSS